MTEGFGRLLELLIQSKDAFLSPCTLGNQQCCGPMTGSKKRSVSAVYRYCLPLSQRSSGFFLAGGVKGTSESYSLALPYPP